MSTAAVVQKDLFLARYYAHRGLYNMEQGIPENSLTAFRAAIEAGFGVELDVQLSADGQVVIFHDRVLKRMCGIDRRLQDLTYKELAALSLANTAETICLFEDVLQLFCGSNLPIIVEFKSGSRNQELCEKVHALLQKYDVTACVESFDPRIVRWFYRHDKKRFRGQLACMPKRYPKSTSRITAFLLSRCLLRLWNRPDFIAYEIGPRPKGLQKLWQKGMPFVGWTSRSPKDGLEDNDALIFENYRPPSVTFDGL